MSALAKLAARFTETTIDDEVIIMVLDNGEFFTLSETAAATWQLIDGHRDRNGLVTALASQYRVDQNVIAADIDELLEDLQQAGVIGRG